MDLHPARGMTYYDLSSEFTRSSIPFNCGADNAGDICRFSDGSCEPFNLHEPIVFSWKGRMRLQRNKAARRFMVGLPTCSAVLDHWVKTSHQSGLSIRICTRAKSRAFRTCVPFS